MTYNPQKIEKKWQKNWEKKKVFEIDLKKVKKPYYNLMMFPYPSAEGLHVGNVYAFTGSDIHGRFKRMQGKDVFEPIGFDAFGIHSENFAIKKKIHPKVLIQRSVNNFRQQLKSLGCLFDWRYEIDTTKPDYYKWTQWLFLQLFKKNLAYRKKAPVDWCPSCKTVLANEQVISGKCERCEKQVIQKEKEQWFFRITKYAERLLKNLDCLPAEALGHKVKITKEMAQAGIDWSERTKLTQKNWIGKSEGTIIKFKIPNSKLEIPVFTTRADTLFGCTYLVLAPENPLIQELKPKIKNWKEVERYILESKNKTEIERISEAKSKTGIELKGIKAINPVNNQEKPIFVADYVLMGYGTGAIMSVPAHDNRDFEFATRYNLPIIEVVSTKGVLINSGKYTGIKSEKAKQEITKFVKGEKIVNYHLRDWLISRQRYWGPPIPIIYCPKCGIVPVPEKDLPVLLPSLKNFRPTGTGKSPLALVKKFVNTKCPKCKGSAQRETDVSDTFLDSSWYYLAYLMRGISNFQFSISKHKKVFKHWLPVDMYIGGQEHAVLHLMYSRFITMALRDLGFIDFEEPFEKFRAHGLITKDGMKMSKSKGNVVNPDDYYKKYGADTLRMYLMFIGPFFEGGDWQDRGVVGIKRFLDKVWNLKLKVTKLQAKKQNLEIEKLIHKTIKKVTEDLENLRYNTAISSLMILTNEMAKEKNVSILHYSILLILLVPFAPHITEELWQKIGEKGSVHSQKWPKYNPKLIKEDIITLIIQINGKIRDKIEVEVNISEEKAKEIAISQEKIKNWVSSKKIKKIIFVPGKLINIVV